MTRVRLDGIFEGTVEFLDEGGGSNPPTPSNPHSPPPPPGGFPNPGTSGRVHTAGPGQQYDSVRAAIAAAADGDTVSIHPGTPRESFVIDKVLMILGNGLKWDFSDLPASSLVFQGKAAIVCHAAGWHIKDMEISGAGINETSATLVAAIRCDTTSWGAMDRCKLHDNQNGFAADTNANWSIVLADCEIYGNGLGDGYTHNIYVSDGHTLTLRNTNSVDPHGGYPVKSRAYNTVIEGGTLRSLDAGCIDVPNGGLLHVKNASLIKPAESPNHTVLGYMMETNTSGVVDTNLIEGTTLNMACDNPQIRTSGGTITFYSCQWQGNPVTVDGSGTVIGLP